MKYFKLKLSCSYAKNKLYRVVYVPNSLTVQGFIDVVVTLFKGDHNKESVLWDGNIDLFGPSYLKKEFSKNNFFDSNKYNIVSVLTKNKNLFFAFDINSAQFYRVDIKLYLKDTFNLPIFLPCLLIRAKGDGFFINNADGFKKYVAQNDKNNNYLYSNDLFLGNNYNFYPRFDYELINKALSLGIGHFPKWSNVYLSDILFDVNNYLHHDNNDNNFDYIDKNGSGLDGQA